MSDDLIIHEENGREYHSAFDLELDSVAIETIKWLVLGHLLYLGGLAFALLASIDKGNVWMTPLYVLPLLWAERKQTNWMRVAVFVIGFTALHYAAVALAFNAYPDSVRAPGGNPMLPGLVGGAAGAFGTLALCAVCGMLKPGAPTLIFAAFGGLLLAGLGSFGVYMYLTTGADESFASAFTRLLWVYSPWQLLFAYVLAKTLKPAGD
ncbi:hypothetical protein OF829_14435 [Sphingomonas sp. LB-2]|uniref:hypothetical protein n=1 Tax=Sphingomonas caeni TaxID=2984949 RepID=UPI00222F35C7|nr:hypothetical protein [Sphingomonas caeni]MCW3848436.1 hypothetical protein [Sphingomonas caeni]